MLKGSSDRKTIRDLFRKRIFQNVKFLYTKGTSEWMQWSMRNFIVLERSPGFNSLKGHDNIDGQSHLTEWVISTEINGEMKINDNNILMRKDLHPKKKTTKNLITKWATVGKFRSSHSSILLAVKSIAIPSLILLCQIDQEFHPPLSLDVPLQRKSVPGPASNSCYNEEHSPGQFQFNHHFH